VLLKRRRFVPQLESCLTNYGLLSVCSPINNLSKYTVSRPHEVASRQGLDVAGDCGRHENNSKVFPVIVSDSTATLVVDSFKPAVVLPTRGPEAEMMQCRTQKL
jgi:hypothetical protein